MHTSIDKRHATCFHDNRFCTATLSAIGTLSEAIASSIATSLASDEPIDATVLSSESIALSHSIAPCCHCKAVSVAAAMATAMAVAVAAAVAVAVVVAVCAVGCDWS